MALTTLLLETGPCIEPFPASSSQDTYQKVNF